MGDLVSENRVYLATYSGGCALVKADGARQVREHVRANHGSHNGSVQVYVLPDVQVFEMVQRGYKVEKAEP